MTTHRQWGKGARRLLHIWSLCLFKIEIWLTLKCYKRKIRWLKSNSIFVICMHAYTVAVTAPFILRTGSSSTTLPLPVCHGNVLQYSVCMSQSNVSSLAMVLHLCWCIHDASSPHLTVSHRFDFNVHIQAFLDCRGKNIHSNLMSFAF
jgi:hypothetical protein